MRNAVILGGNGGIGIALVEHILQQEPDTFITATYRRQPPQLHHSRLRWEPFDAGIESHYARLAESFDEVDLLINCIGLLHCSDNLPEKSIRRFESDFFLQNINANTLPTLLLARYFEKTIGHSRTAYFATVSAKVGSIEDNKLGGWVSYRASKAALNMALKTIAIEWNRTHKNVCVAAIHPGTTDTALSEPFQRNVPEGKLFTAAQSAGYIYKTLNQLTPDDSGGFWSWNGEALPW